MPSKGSARVLVVDHDRNLVEKLCRFLGGREYKAFGASSLSRALSALAEEAPDLVLVDLGLQDGSALELCYAVRGSASAPRLVVMVPRDQQGESLHLVDRDGELLKPFSGRALLDSIEKLCGTTPPQPAIRKARAVERARPKKAKAVEMSRQGAVGVPGGLALRSAPGAGVAAAAPVVRGAGELRTVMHSVGTLENTAFPALLYKLFANEATGILTIHVPGNERVLYFRGGEPVYATSSSASDSLGAILVNLGYVELNDLTQVLQSRRHGQPLGQALIESRVVTPEQLLHALERQVYDRVLAVFGFPSGPYIFIEDSDWIGEVKQFPQNPIQLISDGVNRYVGPNVLAKQLEGHLRQYVVRTEKFDRFRPHFPLVPGTEGALALVDGSRSLQDLATEVGGDLMGLLRLVWSLRLADMVDFLDTPRTTAERSADKPAIPSRPPTDHNLNRALLEQARDLSDRSRQSLPSGAPDLPAGRALAQKVLEYYVRLGYEDSWQLLGVGRDADAAAARMAYQKAMEQLPRKRFELLNQTLNEKAVEVHAALAKALATITDNKQRTSYERRLQQRQEAVVEQRRRRATHIQQRESEDLALSSRSSEVSGMIDIWAADDDPSRDAQSPLEHAGDDADLEADQNIALVDERRARRFADQGRWKDAYHAIKAALKTDPKNPALNIFFAWIVYNLPHEDRSRQRRVCMARLDVQLQIDNCNADGYFYMGRMCEDDRQLADALDYYRTAVALDRGHKAAGAAFQRVSRHPALAESQETGDAASGKLFGRLRALFGSKE